MKLKLRNKKTGEIITLKDEGEIALLKLVESSLPNGLSLWEEVKEPLIKDEKIRKAVRAWAEACRLTHATYKLASNEFYDADTRGKFAIKFALIPIEVYLEDGESYTIAELCGEWEDFGGKDVRRQTPLAELSPYDYSKRNIVTDHTEPRLEPSAMPSGEGAM